MPDLTFQVESAEALANAATPTISFKVRITNTIDEPIQSIALRVQVQLEPMRRRYTVLEQEKLKEMFGEPERWSQSLRPLLWTNGSMNVGGFIGHTTVDVLVPCTFDFNIAITKYIYGLESGELPVTLLFSGTVFHKGEMGLQIAQIPWDREAGYRLPVSVWKEMMDLCYPNTAWLCLPRELHDQLNEFRARNCLHTWEQALARLLECAVEVKS